MMGAVKAFLAVSVVALVVGPPFRAVPREPRACDTLTSLTLPAGAVTSAQAVAGGAVVAGVSGSAPRAFCRVSATLTPSADSQIKIEVWMPAAEWNQKLQAVGNGAFNGSIGYAAMRTALERGYATASTDTGHAGNTARFALGHPEKVKDFGWRAAHEMTAAAKLLVAAYYDTAPRYAYWNGCSAGGRQAMMEAQRFPADFDGIIAGSPGLDWTGRAIQAVRIENLIDADDSARLLEPQRRLVHAAVFDACDALDGVKDGLIENPERCRFDPGVLQCPGDAAAGCLTAAQVATARAMYATVTSARTGRRIFGLEPGSELGWTDLGWTASARATGLDQFRFIVFANPDWRVTRFTAESDIPRADEADGGTINARDSDLRPFFTRGGKLIQYHGWSDPQISPASSTAYYTDVVRTLGGVDRVDASYRLFMAPGMGHCGGGEGPNTFDVVAALEQWVEQRRAPDRILASHATGGVVDRTRPLCPYPQTAAYQGSGSIDDAANFTCRAVVPKP
jgi:feruloyl esterase